MNPNPVRFHARDRRLRAPRQHLQAQHDDPDQDRDDCGAGEQDSDPLPLDIPPDREVGNQPADHSASPDQTVESFRLLGAGQLVEVGPERRDPDRRPCIPEEIERPVDSWRRDAAGREDPCEAEQRRAEDGAEHRDQAAASDAVVQPAECNHGDHRHADVRQLGIQLDVGAEVLDEEALLQRAQGLKHDDGEEPEGEEQERRFHLALLDVDEEPEDSSDGTHGAGFYHLRNRTRARKRRGLARARLTQLFRWT